MCNYKWIYFLPFLALTACGGAGGDSNSNSSSVAATSAALSTANQLPPSSSSSVSLVASSQPTSVPSQSSLSSANSSLSKHSSSSKNASSNPLSISSAVSSSTQSAIEIISSSSSIKISSVKSSSSTTSSKQNSSSILSSKSSSSYSSASSRLSSSKTSSVLTSSAKSSSSITSSSSVSATLLWHADFNDGIVLGGTQSGAIASIENGAYKIAYPQATDGAQYSWLNYNPPANTKQLFISFKVKIPGNKGGLKFLKIFGQHGTADAYSNTTFGLDYTGIDDGVGSLYAISFGDGTDAQNDSQNVILLGGDYPSWIGRSYGSATVKTPMKKSFRAADWGTDWHTFKIMVKFNDGTTSSNEIANGAYYLEIDGNVYVDATGLFNRSYASGSIDHIEFSGWAQGSKNIPNPAFDIYYDDIVVSSGGFIDPSTSSVSSNSKSSSPSSISSSSKSSAGSSSIFSSFSSTSSAYSVSSSSVINSTAGLLWPNGIEPGDPSVCEAPNGKRCWWVDANAATGGNGNYTNPYNDFKVLEQNVRGGDFVYVRGTFDMASNTSTHQMTLNFYTAAASGTANDPTTLKSWRASPRAVFSSNRTSAQVRVTRNGGVRIQNIEITNFGDAGISIDESVSFAELINVVARDGRVTQSSGIGGGVRLYAQDTLHTFIVRNSLFENTSAVSESGDNVGALSLISEPTAHSGSTFKVYNNIFRNNYVAVRHKHAGQIHMEAYNNVIENNKWGFNLRAWSSDIHNNIFVGNDIGMVLNNANSNANHNYTVRYNTFYNNNYFAQALPDWDDNLFSSTIHVANNIFVASSTGLGIFYIGETDWNWGKLDRSLATWTMNNNVFFYQTSARKFLYSPPPTTEYTKDFVAGKTQFGDTTSILADPLFNDAINGDFSLKTGSPAIGAGSNGSTPGAAPLQ